MTARYLLAPCVVMAACSVPARAAGVVGDGSPASCTQAALAAALVGGGIVTFDCGPGTVSIPLTAEQVITASTTIDGGGRIGLLGQDVTRLFRVPDATPGTALTVRGLYLGGGRCPLASPAAEPGFGGAIVAGAGSQVTLVDVALFSNTCAAPGAEAGGGAIHVRSGTVTLLRVSGLANTASNGTIVNAHDSSVSIEDSNFTSNTTTGRGGIVFVKGAGGGRVVLRRVDSLSVNAPGGGGVVHADFEPGDQGLLVEASSMRGSGGTSGDGGALHVRDGSVAIDGSTFYNLAARRGGAVFAQDAAVSVVNATFYNNRASEAAPGDGNGLGGAFFLAGTVTGSVSHSSFVANAADAAGGAFAAASPSSLVLRASLLASNASGTGSDLSPACSAPLASGGFNIQSPGDDADCVPGMLREHPGVGPFDFTGVGYVPLYPDSRATDLVTAGCPPPAVDQRGISRPKGAGCDAGSYEWAPAVTVANASVYEGNSGSTPMTFTVRLSGPSPEAVTVAYATGPEGDATPGVDYVVAAGVLTFAPGDTARTVVVSVLGDPVRESSESFAFWLSAPTGAILETVAADGRIIDDDTPPTISVTGCDVDESDTSCRFLVRLNIFNGAPVTVQYATASGSATAGQDFLTTAGTLTFPSGSYEAFVDVPILEDAIDEPVEVFTFALSAPQNGTIGVGTASGAVHDNDGPVVSIQDVSTFESDADQHIVNLTVTLSAPSPEPVSVGYGTHQGTALAGIDYLAVGSQIVIPPGELTGTVAAVILGDTLDEPDERFRVVLTAQGATVLGTGGMVTIRDDDGGVIRVSELTSGAVRSADLASGDDVYIVSQPPYSSWEVVVDEASGDVGRGAGPGLERMAADLSTVIQFSSPVGVGPARTLRWAHVAFGATQDEYVRVSSHGCGTDCGTDDVYRVRAYETTLRGPRFNCGAGQSTVLLLQNNGDEGIGAWVSPWGPAGAPFPSVPVRMDVPAHGMQVSNVCGYPGLAGASGSITIAHTGAHGQVVGKLVAADAATGASFDTPLTARPR